jgi:hypothetical protein
VFAVEEVAFLGGDEELRSIIDNVSVRVNNKEEGEPRRTWQPLVFGPEFAIDSSPGPVCFS